MPLHIACLRGNVGVAELLLTFGANADVKHLEVSILHAEVVNIPKCFLYRMAVRPSFSQVNRATVKLYRYF